MLIAGDSILYTLYGWNIDADSYLSQQRLYWALAAKSAAKPNFPAPKRAAAELILVPLARTMEGATIAPVLVTTTGRIGAGAD